MVVSFSTSRSSVSGSAAYAAAPSVIIFGDTFRSYQRDCQNLSDEFHRPDGSQDRPVLPRRAARPHKISVRLPAPHPCTPSARNRGGSREVYSRLLASGARG